MPPSLGDEAVVLFQSAAWDDVQLRRHVPSLLEIAADESSNVTRTVSR